MEIKSIHARQILDSRGNPTIEADVILINNILGRASVPSGMSTGSHEALELRDSNKKFFGGMGVEKAVANVNNEIAQKIVGMDADNQKEIDEALIALDGTENKSRLGANAILAVSLAVAKASALSQDTPLYAHIGDLAEKNGNYLMPMPMVNIINGGKHALHSTDIQEFMIMPVGAENFKEAVEMCSEIFHKLREVLNERGYATTVGDEGGYAPAVKNSNEEAFELIALAVEKAGYKMNKDIALSIDVAGSEICENNLYNLKTENKKLTTDEMIIWYKKLTEKYPLISIEDGLAEDDWSGWQKLTATLGKDVQLVGDDLFATNTKLLKKGIEKKTSNAILIKLNQIGTLSETINAVRMAQDAGWNTIISHRSGETEDITIAHLAVGLSTGQIKTGSMSRGERMAKYNELLRIEEELGEKANFANNLF
ncbi:phosphopyruvate hydratase [Candidatus Nomurabacteria bacterium RIFCSPLOWO2_01_FULL_39_17]|uniref:Enolase n=1 Tax=Candidatus Nomurabacteria bacterium RIFCSPLOWO2_01_FULL_39_17 TaxID=1801770 RepID=A0A1F6WWS8_9BACT|nr:MAG: phosphopyruvate hydratase [Candidatus Nomurabacteria bacterium RIFCSPLOWO2_01_FULL_39_17]